MAALYKINYKSDFVLTINSDAGWAVPFCIKFWTGMPSQAYFAGFDGENYVNCRVGDTPTQLLVMFDDHHMPIGELKMQIAYHTTIEEFPDRKFDEVTNPTNVTVDIDGTEYQVMLDFTGETGAEIDFSMPSSGVMSVNGKIGYVTLNAEDVGAQPTIEDLATIRSGAAEGATAYQKPGTGIPESDLASGVQSSLHKADAAAPQSNTYTKGEVDTLIEGAISDIDVDDALSNTSENPVQNKVVTTALNGKQATISDLSTIRDGAAAGATAVQPAALTPIESALQTIESVIPSAASSQNQLADKNFVNSSISTNTANFVGTYNSLAELQAVQNPTNNDYGFVIETDAQGNEYYDRYKYVAASQQWLFEYKVESTPFTAAQWAAIQSGITSALVTKLTALPTNAELQQTLDGKADAADIPTALSQLSQDSTHRTVTDSEKSTWNGKQNAISDLATIRSGAAAGATAVQPAALQEGLAEKQDTISDLATIRSGAEDGATAVQPDEMTAALAGKQNVIEDLSTIRSGAAAGATAVQPAAMDTALAAKQDTLTFDNAPTANSSNPVKSGGIKTALDAKQSTISTVNVTVDNNTGTPSGSASVSGSTLSLSFQNLKGATGATGATGPQGPQGERGLPGESGVTGDVSGFTVIQTIDPSATYGATDIAGAATVQATNAELTELEGNPDTIVLTVKKTTLKFSNAIGFELGHIYRFVITFSAAQTNTWSFGRSTAGSSSGTRIDMHSGVSGDTSYTMDYVCEDASYQYLFFWYNGNGNNATIKIYDYNGLKETVSVLKDELVEVKNKLDSSIGYTNISQTYQNYGISWNSGNLEIVSSSSWRCATVAMPAKGLIIKNPNVLNLKICGIPSSQLSAFNSRPSTISIQNWTKLGDNLQETEIHIDSLLDPMEDVDYVIVFIYGTSTSRLEFYTPVSALNTNIVDLDERLGSIESNGRLENITAYPSSLSSYAADVSIDNSGNKCRVSIANPMTQSYGIWAFELGTVSSLRTTGMPYVYCDAINFSHCCITKNYYQDWYATYLVADISGTQESITDGYRIKLDDSYLAGLSDSDILYVLFGHASSDTVYEANFYMLSVKCDSFYNYYYGSSTNNTKYVDCLGDSLTMGYDFMGWYETKLQELLGNDYSVRNWGVGGETIATIMARQGSAQVVFPSSFVLPYDGSTVQIADASNKMTSAYNGYDVTPLLQGTSNDSGLQTRVVNPCYVLGIECTMAYTGTDVYANATYTLKRNSTGTRNITVPAHTPIYFNTGKQMGKSYITILWMGTNGGYADIADLVAATKIAAGHIVNGRFIVIGLHKLTGTNASTYEEGMTKAFGNKFFNIREYCCSNMIYDAGITPTSEDLTNMANGVCPSSLLYDNTHFKPASNTCIGQKLYEMCAGLGYLV